MTTLQSDATLKPLKGTKLALIQAAGELFAQRGIKGTSTRAIAGKAGSNIGCIHYHFGGKEKLYWAAVEYMFHHRVTHPNVDLSVAGKPTPRKISDVLARLVFRRLRAACGSDVPRWHNQLLWRTISDGMVLARPELIDRVFRPDYERFAALIATAQPGISARRTRLIFYQLLSQIIFYSQHQSKVFRELEIDSYDEASLAEISAHVAVSLTRTLGLPDPQTPETSGGNE